MQLRYAKTLLTGTPGVGKTTLIRKIADRMQSVTMTGFFTTEIRSKGKRKGFELQGSSFIQQIKQGPDIYLIEVTPSNRDQLVTAVLN